MRVQAIWGENSGKCSRHRGLLITLSSPSNVHQCSNISRKNSFARFMPFHFRYWKSYPQKIWNLTTNASSHFISRVPGTRHGFDIVPCFILSYAWWYIFPQLTIRILFHLSPDDILDIFLIFLTMCLMIYLLIFFNIFAHPTALLKSLFLPKLLHRVSHVLHKDVHLKMFIEKTLFLSFFFPIND